MPGAAILYRIDAFMTRLRLRDKGRWSFKSSNAGIVTHLEKVVDNEGPLSTAWQPDSHKTSSFAR